MRAQSIMITRSFTFLLTVLFTLGSPICEAQDFDTYEWEVYHPRNSHVPNPHAREIIFDKKGTPWATTDNKQLIKFTADQWTVIPFPDTHLNWWLNSIQVDDTGKFWIAGYVGKLLTYEPVTGKWDSILFRKDKQPWVIRKNTKNVFLFGCSNATKNNLYQYKNGVITSFGDDHEDVFSITIEPDGNAIVGYRKGLFRYKMKSDGTYNTEGEKLSDLAFYETSIDSKGRIWAAAYSDYTLHCYYRKKWINFPSLPEDIYFDFNGSWKYIIHNVMVLPDDRVVISTQFNPCIAVFDGKDWKAYTAPFEVKRDGIGRIRFGPDSSIWCATSRNGIAVFRAPKKKKSEKPEVTTLPADPPVRSKGIAAAKNKVSYIPDTNRIVKTLKSIEVKAEIVELKVHDDKIFDKDTVSLYFNGKALLSKAQLTPEFRSFRLELKPGDNELLLFAHNMGDVPPNTAAIRILTKDGEQLHTLYLSSDLKSCGKVIIHRPDK
jgi:ligand-binding sensor domain-containing protein